MVLKQQDMLVTMKLLTSGGLKYPFSELAQELGQSASEAVHKIKQEPSKFRWVSPVETIRARTA